MHSRASRKFNLTESSDTDKFARNIGVYTITSIRLVINTNNKFSELDLRELHIGY